MLKENIIYGFRPIVEALRQGKNIEKILIQDNINNDSVRSVKQELKASGLEIRIQYVPLEKLNSLTRTSNHQGIVAFVSMVTYKNIADIVEDYLQRREDIFIVVLDRVTDVRNFGAIARTAECAGVSCLLVAEQGAASINEDAIKTSAGALLRLPVCRVKNIKTTLNYLKQSGVKIFAATEKAKTLHTDENFKGSIAVVMGSENKGVSKDVLKMADSLIKIPILGHIESLNVSVASGIIIYEAIRQRQ